MESLATKMIDALIIWNGLMRKGKIHLVDSCLSFDPFFPTVQGLENAFLSAAVAAQFLLQTTQTALLGV